MIDHAKNLRAVKAYEAARNLALDATRNDMSPNQIVAFVFVAFGCVGFAAGIVSMFLMLTHVTPVGTLVFFGLWVWSWLITLGCFVLAVRYENMDRD